ncbi:hypothetical protein [Butyrivibrio fibrisolvens]|uniref:Membrane associated serine protease, rhomboid family n=1 Tax=Butyrivibrio fibrisolvens TaxID=831 RepID=A0A317G2J1_BUTFI|nr:hypothetical protein [Butyrivibrio fibrisolvens]PWT28128.1 hypothetical protein CPT75_13920 [Butyrivibrio fibrisolvens]
MINKLERKFGRYAIRDLTIKMMIIYAAAFIISLTPIVQYLTLDPYKITHGFQIWRLVTWIFVSSSASRGMSNLFFLAIAIFLFYLPIGRMMESTWGDFRYNLYILCGLLFTIIGTVIFYFGMLFYFNVAGITISSSDMASIGYYIGVSVTPFYVLMSIFFAYAASFPDATVLLMFIIPLQMKWLGIGYAALYGYELIGFIVSAVEVGITNVNFYYYIGSAVTIGCSAISFVVFVLLDKNNRIRRKAGRYRPSEVRRRTEFRHNVENAKKAQRMTAPGSAHHKCAVCGRTEIDDPNLEFRYCSKCKGAYEYCQDHLFTHVHVEK